MAGKRAQTLLDSMLFIELYTLNRAWTDLTDDEMFWEPFAGSWSVRRADECVTPTPFRDGDWAADFDWDLAAAEVGDRGLTPLTTIGWLLWHVGTQPERLAQLDFLGGDRSAESGWTSPYLAAHPVFTKASDAVEAMRAGWRSLDRALQSAVGRTARRAHEVLGLWRSGTADDGRSDRRLGVERSEPPRHAGVRVARPASLGGR